MQSKTSTKCFLPLIHSHRLETMKVVKPDEHVLPVVVEPEVKVSDGPSLPLAGRFVANQIRMKYQLPLSDCYYFDSPVVRAMMRNYEFELSDNLDQVLRSVTSYPKPGGKGVPTRKLELLDNFLKQFEAEVTPSDLCGSLVSTYPLVPKRCSVDLPRLMQHDVIINGRMMTKDDYLKNLVEKAAHFEELHIKNTKVDLVGANFTRLTTLVIGRKVSGVFTKNTAPLLKRVCLSAESDMKLLESFGELNLDLLEINFKPHLLYGRLPQVTADKVVVHVCSGEFKVPLSDEKFEELRKFNKEKFGILIKRSSIEPMIEKEQTFKAKTVVKIGRATTVPLAMFNPDHLEKVISDRAYSVTGNYSFADEINKEDPADEFNFFEKHCENLDKKLNILVLGVRGTITFLGPRKD